MNTTHAVYDLCIIGGGISGLVCADTFLSLRPNSSVLVIEARGTVGGKTLTEEFDGTCFDLGGQWISPSQYIIIDLVKELGLHLEEQTWFDDQQELNLTSGTSAVTTPAEISELNSLIEKIEKMASTVTGPPWDDCPNARDWDSISIYDFLNLNTKSSNIKKEISNLVSTALATSPQELSFLYFLYYVKSAGFMKFLGDGPFGAQHWKVKEGAQAISKRLALRIESKGGKIQCNSIAEKISQNFDTREFPPVKINYKQITTSTTTNISSENSSTLTTTTIVTNFLVGCNHVVIAMSPLQCNSLLFSPLLPQKRREFFSGVISPRAIKVVVLYQNPFWNSTKNKNIQKPIEELGPITNIFPAKIGKYHGLVGLITANSATKYLGIPELEKRNSVLKQIAEFFSDESALNPVYFSYKDWISDKFSSGCYATLFPPKLATEFGDVAGVRWGRISFAGTETARRWAGYFEGAAESGIRAAHESVLSVMSTKKNSSKL